MDLPASPPRMGGPNKSGHDGEWDLVWGHALKCMSPTAQPASAPHMAMARPKARMSPVVVPAIRFMA